MGEMLVMISRKTLLGTVNLWLMAVEMGMPTVSGTLESSSSSSNYGSTHSLTFQNFVGDEVDQQFLPIPLPLVGQNNEEKKQRCVIIYNFSTQEAGVLLQYDALRVRRLKARKHLGERLCFLVGSKLHNLEPWELYFTVYMRAEEPPRYSRQAIYDVFEYSFFPFALAQDTLSTVILFLDVGGIAWKQEDSHPQTLPLPLSGEDYDPVSLFRFCHVVRWKLNKFQEQKRVDQQNSYKSFFQTAQRHNHLHSLQNPVTFRSFSKQSTKNRLFAIIENSSNFDIRYQLKYKSFTFDENAFLKEGKVLHPGNFSEIPLAYTGEDYDLDEPLEIVFDLPNGMYNHRYAAYEPFLTNRWDMLGAVERSPAYTCRWRYAVFALYMRPNDFEGSPMVDPGNLNRQIWNGFYRVLRNVGKGNIDSPRCDSDPNSDSKSRRKSEGKIIVTSPKHEGRKSKRTKCGGNEHPVNRREAANGGGHLIRVARCDDGDDDVVVPLVEAKQGGRKTIYIDLFDPFIQ